MALNIVDQLPKAVVTGCAALGFYYVAKFVVSYTKLLLDLFVLSGTNVSSPHLHTKNNANCRNSSASMESRVRGQS
jgi:hypothetical protein